MFIECLICPRYFAKDFIYIISFKLHNNCGMCYYYLQIIDEKTEIQENQYNLPKAIL